MKIRFDRTKAKILAAALAAAVLLIAAFCLLRGLEEKASRLTEIFDPNYVPGVAVSDPYGEDERTLIFRDGKCYGQKENLETILLFGLDKFEDFIPEDSGSYFNHQQADFCLLLLIDHAAQQCTALHINRDTMTDIHILSIDRQDMGTRYEQLALAHTYGTGGIDSCKNTVRAVSELLYGTQIDHYISMTMDAVPAVNDALGGVELTLMDDLTMDDPAMEQGATIVLTGQQALCYVRARREVADNTNLHRMERQRQYLDALFEKARAAHQEGGETIMKAVLAAEPYLMSDCSADELRSVAECLVDYKNAGIRVVEGEAVVGESYMEYYVDEDALQSLLLELCYEETELPG